MLSKSNIVTILWSLFLIMSCAPAIIAPSNTEERIYLQNVESFPLKFIISKKEAPDAWGRAQSWVAQYSSMKIQVLSDYVIQTYNPEGLRYGYYVTKTPMGDDVEIKVEGITGNMFNKDKAERNARILAYYIKTGKLIPKFISQ